MKKFTLHLGQLKSYGVDPRTFLPEMGYTFRKQKKDFIKETGGGRFHAILSKTGRTVEIHYDVYSGDKHVTFWMPETLGAEQSELQKKLHTLTSNNPSVKLK